LPSQLELVANHRVNVTITDGAIIYRVDGQRVEVADLWHVRAFTTPGAVEGLSPLGHARQAVGLGIAAEQYAAKLFGESAIPSGILTSDHDIKPDRAEQLQARWRARHQGRRDIAVLGSGARFQPITIPPRKPSSSKPPAPTSPPWPATSASSPS
jgi:phage portal protein BeeE